MRAPEPGVARQAGAEGPDHRHQRGRAHRHRGQERRRQVDAARADRQAHRAGRRLRYLPQRHRRGHARAGGLAERRRHRGARRRGRRAGVRVGVRSARPLHPGRAAGRRRLARQGGGALRRAAPALRPRTRARGHVGRDSDGRAHQPPGHGRHHVARQPPQAPLAARAGRASRRDARPLVLGRGVRAHVGGPRRSDRAIRGRLLRLHPAARRAPAPGGRHRGAPPEHAAQGAQLARARRQGAHEQAKVQD
jgi:hypothetical protein